MTVSNTTALNQYTATASQTAFTYSFEVFVVGDLVVDQEGTILSEGTHYTVSGVGNNSGGTVTLITGATAGDVITIYRDMNLERLVDYQQNGDFLAEDVNDDFDRLWLVGQQNSGANARGIRAPIGDAILNATNTELAAPSVRASKVLGFSSTGTIDYVSATIAAGSLNDVSTTSAMTSLSGLSVGDVVTTAEFATGMGAAGGATYDVVLTSGVTPNTYNIIIGVADALLSFVLRVGDTANVKQFGAYGDGSNDDAGAINTACSHQDTQGGGRVTFPQPSSYWKTATTITMYSGVEFDFVSAGYRNGAYNYIRPTSAVTKGITANELDGSRVFGLSVDMQDMNDSSIGIDNRSTWNVTWDHCVVFNVGQTNSTGWKNYSEAAASQGCYWQRYSDCTVVGTAGTGWNFEGQSTGAKRLTSQTMINCQSNGMDYGWVFNHVGSMMTAININAESAAIDGIKYDNASGGTFLTLFGGEITGNTGVGINASSTVMCHEVVLSSNGTDATDSVVLKRANQYLTATVESRVVADRFQSKLSTITLDANLTGSHDGSSGAAVLTDSGEAWTIDEHIGKTLYNTTDSSQTVITSNTATTITGVLSGGTDDDWDSGDSYTIDDAILSQFQYVRVSGASGAISLTSDPQIQDPTDSNCQTIVIMGGSNSNTVTLADGNGLRLVAPITLGLEDAITLAYHSSFGDWVEVSRSTSAAPAYTVTNALTDRSYNANSTTTDELADILGTLIADLQDKGLVQ